jgi:hypothetical protein
MEIYIYTYIHTYIGIRDQDNRNGPSVGCRASLGTASPPRLHSAAAALVIQRRLAASSELLARCHPLLQFV